ncbi:hypothetical protein GYH30_054730 [Glycine max]|uniref:DUF659 domain-containing protein n=1 Tax=Glycine max TaxID=3847 RepID=A0A0R0E6K5_SOYBN|nr:hypothetical protein GYH30_054730 [Glycine max]
MVCGNGSNSSNANTDTSTGSASRSKNAPGNRTDIGWKHGTDVLGNGKKVKCNYCSKINNGGIFRFKHLLAGTRWDSKPCASVPEEVKMLMMNVCYRASGEGVQATLNQLYKKGDKDKVNDQCVEFWYTSAIPFNVIKNPAFAKFCDMVGRYGWKKTGCSIMSDGWTDKKRHSICNFLVNSPKGTVFLYSLDTSDISKIADIVLKMLDDVVNFVGEENVVQKREHLYWTPCVAHCIDLIFEDFEKHLKAHQTTIKKGRRITTYIYGRTMLISIMKKFTNGRDLIRPASLMSMFSSKEWKTSKFGTSQEGRKVQNVALDSQFWKNVTMCLKVATPLMVEMENEKEKIKCNFNKTKKSYEPIWKIIDERWDHRLHRPLHAAAYYLNPHLLYEPTFRLARRGIFSMEEAKNSRKVMQLGEWREIFGDGTPELRRFAIRVLSLTCSSSGCERNWSSFEMQNKMNDLVYVICNLKLKNKQNRKSIALPFDEIESDDEWITEEGYNDEDEQPQGEGDGGNVEVVGHVGGSSNDQVVDAFDPDNLIFVEPNDDAQYEEDLDNDGDGDESDDIHGDDPIRGLDMLL